MGYDVEYQCTLYVDDPVNLTFHYSRGNGGWSGDAPPPDHEGEGLLEGLEQVYAEWFITIKNGNVMMTLDSEKFYDNYMTRMLRLLKERVPSLHGCGGARSFLLPARPAARQPGRARRGGPLRQPHLYANPCSNI